jgi:hypothetical protein
MSLEKKYQIPAETIKKMVNDGIISCSVNNQYEVFDFYQQYKNSNPCLKLYEIEIDVADKFKLAPRTIRHIIYTIGKKS